MKDGSNRVMNLHASLVLAYERQYLVSFLIAKFNKHGWSKFMGGMVRNLSKEDLCLLVNLHGGDPDALALQGRARLLRLFEEVSRPNENTNRG